MSLFMNVLSLIFQLSVQQKMDYIIGSFHLDNNSSLPHNYYQLIFEKDNRPLQLFKQLIKRVKDIKSASGLIKIFTIILKVIRAKQYNANILEILQEIEVPQIDEIQNCEGKWIKQIAISLKSYLKRIPSCGDILKRAMTVKNQKHKIELKFMISDLYRLLNTANLLFPGLTGGINVVGRYYKEKLHYFSHFFNAIKQEITQGYGYIDSILQIVRYNYTKFDEQSLYCVIDALPVIELYCDKTQQLFFNKYFKSRVSSKKIHFKQEQIQKIIYYLENKEKREKTVDLAITSDSQKMQSIYE